ncbi:MAG TPA: gluconate 2-dehydrogenase subunit 3 family protein [Blastocatellia bacterium]|nr:gluconate 2-dehydrogenase subunit 3 family protein [Blastocatellia bacterium]
MAKEQNQTDSIGGNEQSELSRRELLKLGAGAAFGVALTGVDARAIAEAVRNAPAFFTKEEFALVDELAELIIPADDHSPGARAALVAGYIDFRLSESFDDQPRSLWREGLKLIEHLSQEMHARSFLASSREQQVALLTQISRNEAKPSKPEELFFKELKSRTARAYYTSKIGIHSEMEYKGNVSLKEFVGYDAT